MIRSSFNGTTTGVGGAGMTGLAESTGVSDGGTDVCWPDAHKAAINQAVIAAAAKLRAREGTWVVDGRTSG
ncbi:MAG: hypothetical protein WBY44_29980 [Bryobacteraceae bacterium]